MLSTQLWKKETLLCVTKETLFGADMKPIMNKNQDGLLLDLGGCGKDADPLASEISNRSESWVATKHGGSLLVDDFINEIIDSTGKDIQCGTLYNLNNHGKGENVFSSEINGTAPKFECPLFNLNLSKISEYRSKNFKVEESCNSIFLDSNCSREDSDALTSGTECRDKSLNASELEHPLMTDEVTSSYGSATRQISEPCSISLGFLKNDVDLYTGEKITECEMPELRICYKESTCSIIKDICVDEGFPSGDKIITETSRDDQNGSCTSLLPCDENGQNNMVKENGDIMMLVQDGLGYSSRKDCDVNTAKECLIEAAGSESLTQNNFRASDGIVKDAAQKCANDDMMQMSAANDRLTEKIKSDSTDEDCTSERVVSFDKCAAQKSLKSLLEDSKYDLNDSKNDSNQVEAAKASRESSDSAVVTAESNNNKPTDNSLVDNKVGGNIASELDISKCTSSCRDKGYGTSLRFLEPKDGAEHSGEIFGDRSLSDTFQRGEGESSFSATGAISSLISNSGPIAYSGNISLRSDSSTTSTRSFAFPVLQSEWSSSPVRMAKADRRHYHKNRGWKQGLLCCRF